MHDPDEVAKTDAEEDDEKAPEKTPEEALEKDPANCDEYPWNCPNRRASHDIQVNGMPYLARNHFSIVKICENHHQSCTMVPG
jgi:hypothetical protein